MITFDCEYSVIGHFEITEKDALEYGGLDNEKIEECKKSVVLFQDWILATLLDEIELRDNESLTVVPVERTFKIDGKEVKIDKTPEDYKTKLGDGSTVDFKTEEIK